LAAWVARVVKALAASASRRCSSASRASRDNENDTFETAIWRLSSPASLEAAPKSLDSRISSARPRQVVMRPLRSVLAQTL